MGCGGCRAACLRTKAKGCMCGNTRSWHEHTAIQHVRASSSTTCVSAYGCCTVKLSQLAEVSDCKVLAMLADSWQRRNVNFLPSIVPRVILFTRPMPFIALGAQVNDASLQHTYLSLGAIRLFRILIFICSHDVSFLPSSACVLSKARQLQGVAAAPRRFQALTLLFIFSRPLTAAAAAALLHAARVPAQQYRRHSGSQAAEQNAGCCSRALPNILFTELGLGKCCSSLSSQGSASRTPLAL